MLLLVLFLFIAFCLCCCGAMCFYVGKVYQERRNKRWIDLLYTPHDEEDDNNDDLEMGYYSAPTNTVYHQQQMYTQQQQQQQNKSLQYSSDSSFYVPRVCEDTYPTNQYIKDWNQQWEGLDEHEHEHEHYQGQGQGQGQGQVQEQIDYQYEYEYEYIGRQPDPDDLSPNRLQYRFEEDEHEGNMIVEVKEERGYYSWPVGTQSSDSETE